jgi:hypothetical protein
MHSMAPKSICFPSLDSHMQYQSLIITASNKFDTPISAQDHSTLDYYK